MRIAVIGGGIFGATAAVHAARAGHSVDLFEAKNRLLSSASTINQYRLHRGYHYPRSPETARSCLDAQASFAEEYADAVIGNLRHFYGIAKQDSLISAAQFSAFCKDLGLPQQAVTAPDLIDPSRADAFAVTETSVDPDILLSLAEKKLSESGVRLHLRVRADGATVNPFDKVIVAAYATGNKLLAQMGLPCEQYQFEACEKPVVSMPPEFGLTDVVILDGPFMSVGPRGRTGAYVLGHVTHAIHAANVGFEPDIPAALRDYLDVGVIANPRVTHFGRFIESGARYIPALRQARHIGSMYTVRAVLPDREDTDERPTLVQPIGDRVIKIFSGKIVNCVEAARRAVALI